MEEKNVRGRVIAQVHADTGTGLSLEWWSWALNGENTLKIGNH